MISYAPFWNTLKEKNISQYQLINEYDISTGTLDNMRKNKSITMMTIDKLCDILDCQVEDIVKHISDSAKSDLKQ